MSESNKAKIAAARRLLKEHQKKKEVAVADVSSPISSARSSIADRDSFNGNGLHGPPCHSGTPSPTNFSAPLMTSKQSNGSHFFADYSYPPSAQFFDNLPPTLTEEAFKPAVTQPLLNIPDGHQPQHVVPDGHHQQHAVPDGHHHQHVVRDGHQLQHVVPDNHQHQHVVRDGHQHQHVVPDGQQQHAFPDGHQHQHLVVTDRTDSSCSISTKSDDDARRLVALESQLALEIDRKEELETRLFETKENVKILEKEMSRLQDMVSKLSKDRSPQEEKCQMQLRTIEILVSEKAELQQELAAVSEENKQNADKCIELSVKMKALKSEVVRLQSEARDSNEARQQHNSILKRLEHSLNEANSLTEQYKKDTEMNLEEMKELRRIIHESDQTNMTLKKELEESNRKLSMAEMKIAQIGGNVNNNEVASVSSYPQNFEGECEKLREEVARMRSEVAENTSQYKNYIETLNGQLQHMNEEYERCVQEKDELLAHKEGLVKQLCDLEKQISKERLAGPSLSQSNLQLNDQLTAALKALDETKTLLEEKTRSNEQLAEQLAVTAGRLQESELALEQLEVPDAKLLQAAMESDRVAATRAIEQNTTLKAQLNELSAEMNHSIVKLNNEKLDLTEKLQHSEHLAKDLLVKLEHYRHKEGVAYTDSVAQCPMIFQSDYCTQTDVDDLEIVVDPEHATPEAMKLLEEKLKKTMDQVAGLTDEKQRLEHLVLQLQGETETICEYVTLYQKQRGLLREKVIERERQLALLAKERKELKDKLGQINRLLPQATTPTHQLTSGECTEVDPTAASKIKSLLTEIEASNLVQDKLDSAPSSFHPCLLCSGKLITV